MIRALLSLVLPLLLLPALYLGLWPTAPVLDGDSDQYMEVAADLADGRLDAPHLRSAGYPALVAITGSSTTPTRTLLAASLLLHALSIGLLVLALRLAGVSVGWQTSFALIAALPMYVEPAGYVMTETTSAFLLAVTVASLARWIARPSWIPLLGAAVAAACAGLVRPTYQLLGPALAIGIFALLPHVACFDRTTARRGAAVCMAVSLAIVGGVSAYNWRTFGFFGVAPTLGFHLSTKTILFVEQLPNEFAELRDILVQERAIELVKPGGLHDGSQTVWQAKDALERATGLSTPALSTYLVRANLALIARAPLAYLRDVAQSAGRYWLPVAGPLAHFDSPALRGTWLMLHGAIVFLFWLQLATFTALAAVAISRRLLTSPAPDPFTAVPMTTGLGAVWVLTAGIVLYSMVLTCLVDIGEPRQRRSTDLVMLTACAAGAHAWWQALRRPRQV